MDNLHKPDHYNQGAIDVIEGLYGMLPFEQFRGFMKGNIIKYTIRYELKGRTEDLEKAKVYTGRLLDYENLEFVKQMTAGPFEEVEQEEWE